jgi:RHS repeat-associated protein
MSIPAASWHRVLGSVPTVALVLLLAPIAHAEGLRSGQRSDAFVAESSGALELSFPIDAPIGTGGFQPGLAMVYSSHGGDGPLGIGWALSLGEIARSGRFGLPDYDDATDRFELDGELLVRSGSLTPPVRYHTQTERFARILKQPDGRWDVTFPNGVTARYGVAAESRILRGTVTARWLLAEVTDPNGNTIRLIYDRTDPGSAYLSRIEYTYRGGAPVGELRVIDFVYETRPDPARIFPLGVDTTLTKRLREIRSSVGGVPFRRRVLAYNEGSYATGRTRLTSTQLFGRTCSFSEPNPETACDKMPAQVFTYSDPKDAIANSASTQWDAAPSGTWNAPTPFADESGDDLGVRIGDVNGDGLPDLVRAYEPETGTATLEVYLNTGSGWTLDAGWSTALAAVEFQTKQLRIWGSWANVTNVTTSDATTKMYFATGRDWHDAIAGAGETYRPPVEARLADVNGDGRADLLASFVSGRAEINCPSPCTLVNGSKVGEVWLNTGTEWERNSVLSDSVPAFATFWLSESTSNTQVGDTIWSSGTTVGLTRAEMRFASLDGDERVDLIARFDDVTTFYSVPEQLRPPVGAWLYRDSGWLDETSIWTPPVPFALARIFTGRLGYGDTAVRLADVNGDGLDDMIKSAIVIPANDATHFPEETDPIEQMAQVWLNTGSGWCGIEQGCDTARFLPPAGVSFTRAFAYYPSGTLYFRISTTLLFDDLNGDGLLDLVQSDASTPNSRRAWLNDPAGGSAASARWREDTRFQPPTGLEFQDPAPGPEEFPADRGVLLADVDGNGTSDFVRAYAASTRAASLSVTALPDLVSSLENGEGGRWDYTHASAVEQRDAALEALAAADASEKGEASNPLERWTADPVLFEVRVTGIGVGPYVSTYAWAQPRFCTALRSWLGFRVREVERPDSSVLRSYFWQAHGRAGRLSKQDVFDTTGTRLSTAEFAWQVRDGSNVGGSIADVHVGRMTSSTRKALFGEQPGATHATTYSYDDTYGFNFLESITENRPTGSLVTARTPVAIDQTAWIAGLPSTEVETDAAGVVMNDATYQYATGRGLLTQRTSVIRDRVAGAPSQGTAVESWSYDVYGNLRHHVDTDGYLEEFCYDGDTTTSSCPGSAATSAHAWLRATMDKLAQTSRITADPATGQPTSVTAFNGDVEQWDLDSFERPLTRWHAPAGTGQTFLMETWAYLDTPASPQERPWSAHQQMLDGTDGLTTSSYEDGLGRIVRTVSPSRDAWRGSAFQHDYAGRVTRATLPQACSDPDCSMLTGNEPAASAIVYDTLGRPIRETTPDGIAVRDYRREVRAQPVGLGTGTEFDSVLVKTPRGTLTQQILDGARVVWVLECASLVAESATNLTSATCSGSSGSPPPTTFYTYSGAGDLDTIYDATAVATGNWSAPGHRLRTVRDTLGRARQVDDPDGGTKTLVYDAGDRLLTRTNARGETTTYAGHDGLGRPSTVTLQREAPISITYDPVTRGRASVSQAGTYSLSYQYDSFRRVSRKTLVAANKTLLVDYAYDRAGRLIDLVYPESTKLRYEYAGAYLEKVCELPSGVSSCAAATNVWLTDVAYDALGRPAALHTPPGVHSFGYDPAKHRLQHIGVILGGATALDLTYSYDADGNLTSVADAGPAVNGITASATFTHDPRNRLASHDLGGTAKHYRYDNLGNLIGRDLVAPGGQNQWFNTPYAHRLASAQVAAGSTYTYQHDADGNRTRAGPQVFDYDALGRLTCSGTDAAPCSTALTYDLDGSRIVQTTGEVTRILIDDLVEWQKATATTSARATLYVHAFGRKIGVKEVTSPTPRTAEVVLGPGLRVPPDAIAWAIGVLLSSGLIVVLVRAGAPAAIARRPLPAGISLVLILTMMPIPVAWGGPPPPPGPVRQWLFADHLGTPVVIANASLSILRRRIFEPFGKVLTETDLAGYAPPRLFTGKRYEDDVAMYDFGARWYDPVTASFAAVDPVVGDAMNPLALNAYSYVLNRPMGMVDPDGRNGVVSGPSGFDVIGLAMGFNFNGSPDIDMADGGDEHGMSGGDGPPPRFFCGGFCRPGHRPGIDDWKGGSSLDSWVGALTKKGARLGFADGGWFVSYDGKTIAIPTSFVAHLQGLIAAGISSSGAHETSSFIGVGPDGSITFTEIQHGPVPRAPDRVATTGPLTIPYRVSVKENRIRLQVHAHNVFGGPPSPVDQERAAYFAAYGITSLVISRDGTLYLVTPNPNSADPTLGNIFY